MFDNIGGKIRLLARIICLVGFVISGITMIGIWITGAGLSGGFTIFAAGLLTGALSALGAWAGGCLVYGFGRLVEDTEALRHTAEDTQYCADTLRRIGEEYRRNNARRPHPAEEAEE